MLVEPLIAFTVSTVATLWTIRSSRRHGHISGDHDFSGPQKFHRRVVPRIGGVGIFVGLTLAILLLAWRLPESRWLLMGLAVSTMPVFAIGLIEDLTKRVSARRRLLVVASSALAGAILIGATVTRTDIPGLDFIAQFYVGGLVLAVFTVSGVSNSINIIDGMNGLASMCAVLILAGLAYVAAQAGDVVLASVAVASIGAVFGFFIWNYPNGLVFLGDGGAYFIGFVIGELSLLLLQRNPNVSPLFPLLLCAYPVFETLFSMYRRRVLRGHAVSMPDGIHLHSLIYRRLIRWAVGSQDAVVLTRRNSMTAPYLWMLCCATVVPAMFWWDNSAALSACIFVFIGVYMLLYGRIVTFRTPRVLVRRGPPKQIAFRRSRRQRWAGLTEAAGVESPPELQASGHTSVAAPESTRPAERVV